MRRPILWAIPVLLAAGLAATRTLTPPAAAQTGDTPLSIAEVALWFNQNPPAGRARPGNEVEALVDGKETFERMAAAISSAWAERDPANPPKLTLQPLRDMGGSTDLSDPVWCTNPGLIAEDADGNLLTTSTTVSSPVNRGRIFRVTPDGKTVTVLHKFEGPNGDAPASGLTRASDGSFYGSTYAGGKHGTGTIFRIGANGGGHSIVWNCCNGKIDPPPVPPNQPTEQQKLDAAGSYPLTPPVELKGRGLYGVTSYANNQQYGVLYTLTPAFKGLYFFKGDQGRLPASLIAGSDGNLYGTTLKGDTTCPNGTIFRATPSGGVTALHRFVYTTGHTSHNIAQGRDGHLYGTAAAGGSGTAGVLYRLTLPTGSYEVLHHFTGREDGGAPLAGVVHARDGFLYGVTTFGGTGGRGTAYRIRPDGKDFATLYNFPSAVLNGTGRHARITPVEYSRPGIAGDPRLYGITYQGGSFDKGVFYRLEVPRFIYLAGWWLTDRFPLAAGDPASTIEELFKKASDQGVPVRALLWDGVGTQNTAEVDRIKKLSKGAAILDNYTLNLGSHHQKLLLVGGKDGMTAFLGGVDINPDRVMAKGVGANAGGDTEGAPLHDVHCRIRGPAVGDLLRVFAQRWDDHPDRPETDGSGEKPEPVWGARPEVFHPIMPDPIPGATCWVQIGRTYPNGTTRTLKPGALSASRPYSFAPKGEQTAAAMILHGIRTAKEFIYLEEQYFVDTSPNTKNYSVRDALAATLAKPTFKHLTVVIPHSDITKMGPGPQQVNYRRKLLIDALKKAGEIKDAAGKVIGNKVRVFYRLPIGGADSYVHAKCWIFDDRLAIIGSANTNRRSWTHDSEVVAGICDQGNGTSLLFPRRLRMRLWSHHLGLPAETFRSGVASADYWTSKRPAGASVAPYEVFKPELLTPDATWNDIDPDGS
jgi:uncharacterized repeat protein (TIGR03803 family)